MIILRFTPGAELRSEPEDLKFLANTTRAGNETYFGVKQVHPSNLSRITRSHKVDAMPRHVAGDLSLLTVTSGA